MLKLQSVKVHASVGRNMEELNCQDMENLGKLSTEGFADANRLFCQIPRDVIICFKTFWWYMACPHLSVEHTLHTHSWLCLLQWSCFIVFLCVCVCVGGAIFVFSCDLNLLCSLAIIYVQVEIDWFLWGKWQCPFRYFLVMYIFWWHWVHVIVTSIAVFIIPFVNHVLYCVCTETAKTFLQKWQFL